MDVYHEILPDRFVLLLADGPSPDRDVAADNLARCLLQACRSGKTSVWVDCSRLHAISPAARDLLLAYHRRLQRRAARLVLSATCARVREAFADVAPEYRPELAVEALA